MRVALAISFPYKKQIDQKEYFEKEWSLSTNKALSIQVSRWGHGYTLFSIDIHLRRYSSHAGLFVELELLNRAIIIDFFDKRHWNYTEGRWCLPGEE